MAATVASAVAIATATDNDLQVSTTERKVAFTTAADADYKLQTDASVCVLGRIYGIVLVRTSLLHCLCIQSFPLLAGGKGRAADSHTVA